MSRSFFSRRAFGKKLGTTVGASALLATGVEGQLSAAENSVEKAAGFPSDFLWGCATAAYQIEGGYKDDGRGPSIWDTFSHQKGHVKFNQTGDVADDDYHRYKEDIQLMKDLGVKSYRFSVSWPRIFPQGTGSPNPKGIDFYSRVVDELLANDIKPFCTLFHWDLPQALQDRVGGWQSRETAKAFGEYAGYVASKLSDRVHHFFTLNELSSFIDLGYRDGRFAPGLKLAPKELNQARHNAVLAHGYGVQAIRAQGKPGTKVGLAENAVVCVPAIATQPHIEAAEKATRMLNAQYLSVMMDGRYPELYLEEQGAAAPKFTDEDLKIIGSPIDFLGCNIYTGSYIRAAENKRGFEEIPRPASYPHMASDWLFVCPESLYWGPRNVHKLWNIGELYITENGTSASDKLTADNHVYDTDRVMYLRSYMANVQRAISEGIPVRGYFLWSLMDNFEWADGYTLRFGLYYVNYKTQQRIPKLSAQFYRETIASNAVC